MPTCVTANVRPAIVRLPRRCDVAVLGATAKLTCPLFVPCAPEVTVIHDVSLVAVQAHPLEVVTVDDPLAPANGTCCMLVGEMLNAHDAAFCVTVNV